jgi:hypothetical protein
MKYILGILILISCSVQNPDSYLYANKEFICNDGCAHVQKLDCNNSKPHIFEDEKCSSDAECSYGECIAGKCGIKCNKICIKQQKSQEAICWLHHNSCEEIDANCKN